MSKREVLIYSAFSGFGLAAGIHFYIAWSGLVMKVCDAIFGVFA